MKKKDFTPGKNVIVWDPGEANPKQKLFYASRTLYTAYGGAKGGGKTHAVRIKAVGGALTNAGIKILIMRQTYKDLERNHITPILKMTPREVYSYNGTSHIMTFENGSSIEFGHWQGEASEQEYNGIEYDWIFIDEATQFSERAFQFLGGCLRGANNIPKRMYLTANPGGVGHRWFKRLFIDKIYKTDSMNPEENENPEDYTFIPATVEDNTHMLNSPGGANYLRMLANMPENLRQGYRYGDWNAIGGNYFPEFQTATHVRTAFKIPPHWTRYRSFDYGLDMFACYWIAVDEDGRGWVYREYTKKDLIVRDAAEKIHENTLPNERIATTYAPPDMWSRQKDSGKTMAELFMVNDVGLVKSQNNRVQGHMMIKDLLAPIPVNDPYVKRLYPDRKELPGLMFFSCCKEVIGDLQDIQADEDNPNDCAKEPHEITHTVDGIRYYAVSRTMKAELPEAPKDNFQDAKAEEYQSFMCGGEADESYLSFGGIT
jgi:phage terminase large subunit